MLVDIGKVVVVDRVRKDYGNIEELAKDISENGLINPPVTTPDFRLIAGERRLRACKYLGMEQIEIRVMSVKDAEHQLRMEISENENRKEFTFSERIDWARRLEAIEKIKAEERQSTLNGKSLLTENFPEAKRGETRDIVAKESGFGSGKQYEKAKFVADNASEEVIKKLNEEKMSIHKAYIETKEKLKEETARANKMTESYNAVQAALVNTEQKEKIVEREKIVEVKVVDEEQTKYLKDQLFAVKKERDLIANELKKLEDHINSEQGQIERLKMQEEKLKLEGHIGMFDLQINIQKFIKENTPNVFLQGAIASNGVWEKAELMDSVVALEEFTRTLREIVQGEVKTTTNTNFVIDVTN